MDNKKEQSRMGNKKEQSRMGNKKEQSRMGNKKEQSRMGNKKEQSRMGNKKLATFGYIRIRTKTNKAKNTPQKTKTVSNNDPHQKTGSEPRGPPRASSSRTFLSHIR